MKKLLLLLTGIFVLNNQVFAYNIVYPKFKTTNEVTINSATTAFIGNARGSENLQINGENVKVHKSGGFKHSVNLSEGVNTFVISSNGENRIFKIKRELPKNNSDPLVYKEFASPIYISTNSDNIPLRSTPVDFGLNRLQHLDEGIDMIAIGEYGNFYKVKIARDDYAWISKNDVSEIMTNSIKLAHYKEYKHFKTEKEEIFEFILDKRVPYVISEINGLDVIIYGLENCPFSKFETHINKEKLTGYKVFYDENNLIIKIKNLPPKHFNKPLGGVRITIDAGHGGSETGAIGCLGHKEKDVNLAIALKLKKKLETAGATVFMTRETDKYISLSDRVKFTNDNDSHIFISIHNNALPDSLMDKDISGTEIYYFYPQGKILANSLMPEIIKHTGMKNGGIKGQSFAVVRNTQAASILIEVGYMINPEDNEKIINENFQDKLTEGILKGLENYLK